jgi:serine/threonine protein kinase HipA of HipAB toxin-antitoxin module
LREDRRIDAPALEAVRRAYTFGGLIANTDRHFGNLAFFDTYDGRFQLAPLYDMLPMLFAPEHNQITARSFVPPEPVSDTLAAWAPARALAERYWRQLAADARLSDDFRGISTACLAALESLPRTGPYA